MDVIGAVLALPLAVLLAAAGNQAANEFRAWTPRLTRALLYSALRRVPDSLRERLSEEWASHLDDTPGEVAKLFAAFGLRRAAFRLRRQAMLRLRWRELLSSPDLERRVVASVYDAMRDHLLPPTQDGAVTLRASGADLAKSMTLRQVGRMRFGAVSDWLRADGKARWGTALGRTIVELMKTSREKYWLPPFPDE